MNDITGLIGSILQLFGITSIPQTAQELVWCLITIVVGLYVFKYCVLFILEIMKEMVRIR